MAAYYNEIDGYAAQWLRNLIAAGHIAPGDVDERSIEDVRPDDIKGYKQCHFFAGIGVWSYALRLAGWSDHEPIWTGSAPCQPFSSAGKRKGFGDERHLWPVWFRLIETVRPRIILGEQVSGARIGPWLDLIQDDFEGVHYAFGAAMAPASCFGAPHIRKRTYWVAYSAHEQRDWSGSIRPRRWTEHSDGGATGGLADRHDERREGRDGGELQERAGELPLGARGSLGGLGDGEGERRERRPDDEDGGRRERASGHSGAPDGERPGPVNGFWRDADWLLCTDGKWRPVEPGTFPLVDGTPSRVGRLRAYGNAIVAEQAKAFIEAVMEYAP